jgi:hypothetical protein
MNNQKKKASSARSEVHPWGRKQNQPREATTAQKQYASHIFINQIGIKTGSKRGAGYTRLQGILPSAARRVKFKYNLQKITNAVREHSAGLGTQPEGCKLAVKRNTVSIDCRDTALQRE